MAPSSPDDDQQSVWGAAARAVQGVVVDQLAIGTVLLGVVLMAYAAVETHGPVLLAGLVVGALSVVVPFVSWHQRWSDRTSWVTLLPLLASVVAVFAWTGR